MQAKLHLTFSKVLTWQFETGGDTASQIMKAMLDL